MKMIGTRMVRKLTAKCLVWLGFAATPFVFMACYGPAPKNYEGVAFEEEAVVDSLETAADSTVVEMAEAAAEE